MSSYQPKLSIKGFTLLQNLRQELAEVSPYQKNIVETVRNLKRGIQSEQANIQIILEQRAYAVVGICHQTPTDHFLRLGSLLQLLSHLEESQDYKDAAAIIEPLEQAIIEADAEEQRIQQKANEAAAALRAAETAALERAKQDPEFLKAQKQLRAVEAMRK